MSLRLTPIKMAGLPMAYGRSILPHDETGVNDRRYKNCQQWESAVLGGESSPGLNFMGASDQFVLSSPAPSVAGFAKQTIATLIILTIYGLMKR